MILNSYFFSTFNQQISTMKNLSPIFIFLAFVSISFFSSAQIAKSANAGNAEEIKNNLNENKLVLTIPSITKEEVEKYAHYYVKSFNVKLSNKNQVTFHLTENSANNNRVVLRFLSAINVQQIAVSEKDFALSDFYEAFLK